jgi:hypothetical protein
VTVLFADLKGSMELLAESRGGAQAPRPGDTTNVAGLRAGTLRQRNRLVPTDQLWSRSAQPPTTD